MKPIQITTPRLYLRQWQPEDRPAFAALNADPLVMRYFPGPLSPSASDELARRLQGLIQERGWGCWAVEIPGTVPFIGFVGLHVPSANLPFSPCVEIAWRLAADFWGKGYASEAADAVLRVGFEQLGLDEIVSFATATNHRSIAVMQRLGMSHTGEIFDHPEIPIDNALRPHVLYRLTKAQWRQRERAD